MAKRRDVVTPGKLPQLSIVQTRVLLHLCNGMTIKQIAKVRGCSLSTVKHHLSIIMIRWGVHRSDQLYPAILKWAGRPSPGETVREILKPPSGPG